MQSMVYSSGCLPTSQAPIFLFIPGFSPRSGNRQSSSTGYLESRPPINSMPLINQLVN